MPSTCETATVKVSELKSMNVEMNDKAWTALDSQTERLATLRCVPLFLFFDHYAQSASSQCWHPRCMQHAPSGGLKTAHNAMREGMKRFPQAV